MASHYTYVNGRLTSVIVIQRTSYSASPSYCASPNFNASSNFNASPNFDSSTNYKASPCCDVSPNYRASPCCDESPNYRASTSYDPSPSLNASSVYNVSSSFNVSPNFNASPSSCASMSHSALGGYGDGHSYSYSSNSVGCSAMADYGRRRYVSRPGSADLSYTYTLPNNGYIGPALNTYASNLPSYDVMSKYGKSYPHSTDTTYSSYDPRSRSRDLGSRYGVASSTSGYDVGSSHGNAYGTSSSSRYSHVDNKRKESSQSTTSTRRVRPAHERYRLVDEDSTSKPSRDVTPDDIRSQRFHSRTPEVIQREEPRSRGYHGSHGDGKAIDTQHIKGTFELYSNRKNQNRDSFELEQPVFSSVEESFDGTTSYPSTRDTSDLYTYQRPQRSQIKSSVGDSLERPSFDSPRHDSLDGETASLPQWRRGLADDKFRSGKVADQYQTSDASKSLIHSETDNSEVKPMSSWRQRRLEREKREKEKLKPQNVSDNLSISSVECKQRIHSDSSSYDNISDRSKTESVNTERRKFDRSERPKSIDVETMRKLMLTSESPILRSRYKEALRKRDELGESSSHGSREHSEDGKLENKDIEKSVSVDFNNKPKLVTSKTSSVDNLKQSVKQSNVPVDVSEQLDRRKTEAEHKKKILVSSRSKVDNLKGSVARPPHDQISVALYAKDDNKSKLRTNSTSSSNVEQAGKDRLKSKSPSNQNITDTVQRTSSSVDKLKTSQPLTKVASSNISEDTLSKSEHKDFNRIPYSRRNLTSHTEKKDSATVVKTDSSHVRKSSSEIKGHSQEDSKSSSKEIVSNQKISDSNERNPWLRQTTEKHTTKGITKPQSPKLKQKETSQSPDLTKKEALQTLKQKEISKSPKMKQKESTKTKVISDKKIEELSDKVAIEKSSLSKQAISARRAQQHRQDGASLVKHMSDLLFEKEEDKPSTQTEPTVREDSKSKCRSETRRDRSIERTNVERKRDQSTDRVKKSKLPGRERSTERKPKVEDSNISTALKSSTRQDQSVQKSYLNSTKSSRDKSLERKVKRDVSSERKEKQITEKPRMISSTKTTAATTKAPIEKGEKTDTKQSNKKYGEKEKMVSKSDKLTKSDFTQPVTESRVISKSFGKSANSTSEKVSKYGSSEGRKESHTTDKIFGRNGKESESSKLSHTVSTNVSQASEENMKNRFLTPTAFRTKDITEDSTENTVVCSSKSQKGKQAQQILEAPVAQKGKDDESKRTAESLGYQSVKDSVDIEKDQKAETDLGLNVVGSGDVPLSRAERIARYKEERRRQLAYIANKLETLEKDGGSQKDVVPSLFHAAREKSLDREDTSTLGRSRSLKEKSKSPEKLLCPVSRSRSLRSDFSPKRDIEPESRAQTDSGFRTSVTSFDEEGKEVPLTMKIANTRKLFEQRSVEDEDIKLAHRRSLTDSTALHRRSITDNLLNDERSVRKDKDEVKEKTAMKESYTFGTSFGISKEVKSSSVEKGSNYDKSKSEIEIPPILVESKSAKTNNTKDDKKIKSTSDREEISSKNLDKSDKNVVPPKSDVGIESTTISSKYVDVKECKTSNKEKDLPEKEGIPVQNRDQHENGTAIQVSAKTLESKEIHMPMIKRKLTDPVHHKIKTREVSTRTTDLNLRDMKNPDDIQKMFESLEKLSPVEKDPEDEESKNVVDPNLDSVKSVPSVINEKKTKKRRQLPSIPSALGNIPSPTVKSNESKVDSTTVSSNRTDDVKPTDVDSTKSSTVPSSEEKLPSDVLHSGDTTKLSTVFASEITPSSVDVNDSSKSTSVLKGEIKPSPTVSVTQSLHPSSTSSSLTETSSLLFEVKGMSAVQSKPSFDTSPSVSFTTSTTSNIISKSSPFSGSQDDISASLTQTDHCTNDNQTPDKSQNVKQSAIKDEDSISKEAKITYSFKKETHENVQSETMQEKAVQKPSHSEISFLPDIVPNISLKSGAEKNEKSDKPDVEKIDDSHLKISSNNISDSKDINEKLIVSQADSVLLQEKETEKKEQNKQSRHAPVKSRILVSRKDVGKEGNKNQETTTLKETVSKDTAQTESTETVHAKIKDIPDIIKTESTKHADNIVSGTIDAGESVICQSASVSSLSVGVENAAYKYSDHSSREKSKSRSTSPSVRGRSCSSDEGSKKKKSGKPRFSKSGLHRSKTITEKELQSTKYGREKQIGNVVITQESTRKVLLKSPETNLDDLLLQNVDYLSDIETKEPWEVKKRESAASTDEENQKRRKFHPQRREALQRRKSESDSLLGNDVRLQTPEVMRTDVKEKAKAIITEVHSSVKTVSEQSKNVAVEISDKHMPDKSRENITNQETDSPECQREQTDRQIEVKSSIDDAESAVEIKQKETIADESDSKSTINVINDDKGEVTDKDLRMSSDLNEMKGSDSDTTTVSECSVGSVRKSDTERRRRVDKSSLRKSSLNMSQTDEFIQDVGRRGLTTDSRRLGSHTSSDRDNSIEGATDPQRHGVNSTNHTQRASTVGQQPPPPSTSKSGFSILDSILPSRFALQSKVSSAISKFSNGNNDKTESHKTEASPRRIARRNDFSSLLQKFSSSDQSSSENEQGSSFRKRNLRRQEAYTVTSSDESDTRKTPERTQSLRVKKLPSPDKNLQRSESFRSEFMRRRYSPEPKDRIPLVEEKPEPKHKDSEPLGGEKQDSKDRAPSGGEVPESESKINESLQDKLDSKLKESELVVQEGKEVIQDVSFVEDKTTSDLLKSESETKMAEPSPELAAVLNRRQKVVTEQQAIGEVEERNRIHSKVIEKEGLIGHVPEVEEIIADNEVASVLRSRRQCKQEVEKYDKLDKGQCHKKVDDLGEIIADSEVAQMLKARRKETDSKFAEIVLDKPEPAHQDISKSSISTSSSSVSIKAPSMMQAHDKDKTSAQSITAKISSQMVSSSDVGVKNIVKRSRDSDSSCDEANKKDITSSVTSKSSFDNLSSKKDARANITSKYPIRKSIIEKQKSPEPVIAVSARVVKKITGPVNESDSANSSASETKVSPERTLRSKMSPLKDTLSQESSTTSLAIRRTESQKLKEAERPRGILKRTASAKKSGVIVDSELASILQRRRQKEGEEEEEEEKEEVSSVQAEIEETRRRESEHSSSIGDDEGVGKLSIAERIYHMQNRLEESKSGPITPKSASGATTPKYPLKGRAGSLTSKSSFSFDEPSESPSHIRGEHLIEKLSAIADKDKDFPQVAEKRALFQRSRKREDWRTRTQPVTQEEIQEADGAEVLRKSSASVFEKLSSEETANQKTEFPQHIPSSKDRRQRSERHKTLPVTAAELNAIPEGELAAISQLNRKPDGKGYRDSRADSGILSGSSDIENNYDSLEREPQTSDSLRSLGIEMDDTDDDPARMSVSAKASLFKQLAEKPKSSASGAKRYIDRKKRERSRTQPVTEDEVKDAAEIADGETTSEPSSKKAEKSEEIQKEIEETKQAEDEGLADDLSRKSLSEKVKLFSTLKELEKEETKKKVPPVVRKKNRKLTSRFNTQPVTVEEVEKAAAYRISPLAMSMVKPPDPEMLKGLSLSAQRELMAQHAEKVMSQPSSRSNSRHSSSIDLSEESAKGVVKSTEDIPKGDKGEEKPIGRKSVKELSKSVGDELSRIGREPRIPGGVRQINVDTHEELKRKFLKSGEAMEQKNEKVETKVESEQTTNDDVFKRAAGLAHEALAKTKEERKGILKKDGSFELSKVTSSSGVVEKSGTQDSIDEKTEKKDVEKDNTVTENGETESEKCAKMKENLEKVIEKCDQVLEKSEKATSSVPTSSRVRDIRENTPEKEKSPERQGSVERKSAGGCASAIRRRGRDTKQPERYLTQPTETESPGKSPDSVRKMKYGAVRHKTQPVTPEEKREAEAQPEVGSSLKDRLSLLKKSGEEEWKKRVSRNLDYDSGSAGSSPEVKRRNKVLDFPRPSSIADRLNLLDKSQEGWRERVGETDAKRFTVAHKLAGQVEESPLMRKLKEKTRKETESDQSSSEVTSPSTPTREKIPLPTSIISGPPSEKAKPEPEVKVIAMEEEEVPKGPVKITIPSMDDEHLQSFFMSRQVTEVVKENVDVSIDDFNELFIIANDMLPSTRKIRPKRKHTASSKNPLKTMKTTVEIKTEYEEVSSGIAEKELKRLKTAAIAKDAGFAEAALAGLASKENFAKVELRKTNGTNVGKSPARLDPYKDLMLIHVKGRRRTQVRLVEPSYKSINSGDCYILVTPDKCIIWVGEFANVIEKAKAADIATFIHQKRDMGCKASQVDTVEEARHHLGTGKKFWAAIGGMGTISSAGPTEEDELYENHIVDTNMVYRLQDNSLVPCEEHWGNVPKHEMLKKDEVYVFDFGSELYIWQGKAVKPDQRKLGVKLARQLWETGYDYSACDVNPVCPLLTEDLGGLPSKAKERPSWALFGKVNQNMETILFREKFADWPDTSRLIKVKSTEDVSSMKNELADLKPYDAKLLLPLNTKPVSLMLEGSHVGRGRSWAEDMEGFIREQDIVTLGVTVWHVLEFEHLVVPEQSFGQFHDGDTYVVRWQYMITNKGLKDLKGSQSRRSLVGRERCAYFFWQGKHSTINEKGASALMTVELDEERGPQIRVDEGKEMPCFLNLFDGKMIIHIGKREEEETNTQGPCRSYCVRNEYESELCLIEVPTGPQQLRSHSSLLIFNVTSGLLYVWHGCKSPQHTRDLALKAAEKLKEKCPLEVGVKDGCYILIKEQEEGKELPEFWSFIGAKQEDRRLYHSLLKDPLAYDVSIRLFHMTSVSGVFEVNEVLNPSRTPDLLCTFPVLQSDLYKASQPALFLLDNRHIVYLWHGWWHEEDIHTENIQTGSAKSRFNIDRKCAMDTVIQYCKEKNPENPPCACAVYAGLEPLEFTNLFPYWETDESAKSINLRDGKVEGEVTMLEEILQKVTQTRYTFEELCEETLPDGVDPLKLEAYLEEEEFEEILEMSKEEFYSLPNWKQNKLKQQVGLF